MASDASGATVAATPPRPKTPVDSIAGQIAHLSSGRRAQLRRLYLTESHAADGIVIDLLHRAGVTAPTDLRAFDAWRLLAHCAALLSGTGGLQPHAAGRRLGTALHAAGLSENRLLRLTAARGAGLEAQLIRAMRMVAQHGEAPVNLHTLFDLIGDDPDDAEAARLRIAHDYYAAEARSEKGVSSDD